MMQYVLWIGVSGLIAGVIGSFIASTFNLDPTSTVIGAAIGGGAGGWIAKQQTDSNAEENHQ